MAIKRKVDLDKPLAPGGITLRQLRKLGARDQAGNKFLKKNKKGEYVRKYPCACLGDK